MTHHFNIIKNDGYSGIRRNTKKWGSIVYYYKNNLLNGRKKIILFDKINNKLYGKMVYENGTIEYEIENYIFHDENPRMEGIQLLIEYE